MSLAKAIEHGKEHRKPYFKSERFDKSCRPHGECPWCKRRHTISSLRVKVKAQDELAHDCECEHESETDTVLR
jgi:hypothetical protein